MAAGGCKLHLQEKKKQNREGGCSCRLDAEEQVVVVRWLQLPRGRKKIAGGMGAAVGERGESRGGGRKDWGKGVAAAKRRVATAAPMERKIRVRFFWVLGFFGCVLFFCLFILALTNSIYRVFFWPKFQEHL